MNEQPVAHDLYAPRIDDHVALRHERDPCIVRRCRDRRGEDTPTRRVERRDTYQSIVDHACERLGFDSLDEHRARTGRSVDEMHVGAAPADVAMHDQPAAVARQRDRLHRLLDGEVAEDELVVTVVVADHVPPDSLAVLGPRRVAGVRERVAARRPPERRPPCVGDRVGQQRGGLDVDDTERGPFVAADRDAERDLRPVRGRVVPVECGSRVFEQRRGVDERRRRGARVVGRSHDQPKLRLTSRPLEREQPVAGDAARGRDRRGEQLDEASVERRSRGSASRTRRVRSFCALTHERVAGEVGSSSHRYGSATSWP